MALRVLAEKVGLAGYADMPGALAGLARRERAAFCNEHWQAQYPRVRGPPGIQPHIPSKGCCIWK